MVSSDEESTDHIFVNHFLPVGYTNGSKSQGDEAKQNFVSLPKETSYEGGDTNSSENFYEVYFCLPLIWKTGGRDKVGRFMKREVSQKE